MKDLRILFLVVFVSCMFTIIIASEPVSIPEHSFVSSIPLNGINLPSDSAEYEEIPYVIRDYLMCFQKLDKKISENWLYIPRSKEMYAVPDSLDLIYLTDKEEAALEEIAFYAGMPLKGYNYARNGFINTYEKTQILDIIKWFYGNYCNINENEIVLIKQEYREDFRIV